MLSRSVRLPSGLVAMATTSSNVGKNATNKLKAMACEIMLQRGNTRRNIFIARRSNFIAGFIGRHYTCTLPGGTGSGSVSGSVNQVLGRKISGTTKVHMDVSSRVLAP